MLKVYTAQYRYAGQHRLDITVKGKDPVGRVFAPNWDIVMKHKNNPNYGDKEYTEDFHNLMIASLDSCTDVWMEDVLKRGYVVLVCFCPAGAFCHRKLVAEYLVQLGAKYMGEIDLNDKEFTLPLTPPTVAECFGKEAITEFQKEYR